MRFFILCFFFPLLASAQPGLLKYNATSGDPINAYALASASNGGLWVLGAVGNGSENVRDAVVLRLDEDGNVSWSRAYDAGTFQSIQNIAPTQDGGFIIGGTATTDYFDIYVAKATVAGDIEWSVFLGDDGLQRGFDITPALDGGYFIVGHHYPDFAERRSYVGKLDNNGNLGWAKVYGLPEIDQTGSDVIPLPGGGCLIAGNLDSNEGDAMLFELDEMGNVVWAKSYDYQNLGSAALSIASMSDGHIAFLQRTAISANSVSGESALIMSRLTSQGDEVWSQTTAIDDALVFTRINGINFGFSSSGYAASVTAEDDIVVATTADFDQSDDIRPNLFKLSGVDGALDWAIEFADEGFLQNPIYQRGSPLAINAAGNYAYIYQSVFDDASFQIATVDPQGQGVCAATPTIELQAVALNIQDVNLQVTDLNTIRNVSTTVTDYTFTVEPIELSLDLGPDQLLCEDDPISLEPMTTYEGSYLWNTGDTTSSITIDTPGVYILELSNTCGSITDTIEVSRPVPATFSINHPESVCQGAMATITADIGASTNANWQNLDGVLLSDMSTLGIVINQDTSLVLTTTDGCAISTDTIFIANIPPPPINTIVTNASCSEANGAIMLEITSENFNFIRWRNAAGEVIATNETTITDLTAGTYNLTIASRRGCQFMDSILVADEGIPEVEAFVQDIGCTGTASGSIRVDVLNGLAPYTFSWAQDGQRLTESDDSLVDLMPGSYALTLTDANNCMVVIEDLVVNSAPTLIFASEVTVPDCPGESTGSISTINLSGGTPPYLFSIDGSPFQIDTVFNNLASGQYTVTMQDAQGCDTSLTVEIPVVDTINIELAVSINPTKIGERIDFQVLGVEALNASSTISWQSNPPIDLSCTDCIAPSATAVTSSSIIVNVTTNSGCVLTDSLMLVVENNARVYIPTAFSPNGDKINDTFEPFPGPGVAKILNFEIYNRWGGLVFQASDSTQSWDGTINGERTPTGVYIYTFEVRWLDGLVQQYSGEVQLIR